MTEGLSVEGINQGKVQLRLVWWGSQFSPHPQNGTPAPVSRLGTAREAAVRSGKLPATGDQSWLERTLQAEARRVLS